MRVAVYDGVIELSLTLNVILILAFTKPSRYIVRLKY